MHGARVLEVRGSFDDALAAARALAERGTHALVNSLNPHRLEGQKTAVFEIVDELGAVPDVFVVPYGGGGNTVSYAKGLSELAERARLVSVQAADRRRTVASAIRIAEPAHREVVASLDVEISTVTDAQILEAWAQLAKLEGLFCEPSSAAGLAALTLDPPRGARVVATITGHGLKDPDAAARVAPEPLVVDPDPDAIAAAAAGA
jgi:threonine synthase